MAHRYSQHAMGTPNWRNKTIFTGDNLYVMRGMNSETVDLIYADPPFNSNKNYSAPVGSKAAGAAFKDTWTLSDLDEAWHAQLLETNEALYHVIQASRYSHGEGMMSYLCMMAVRLLEMRRLLKPTGSIYLHCDPYASHYLKPVMDTVFGHENFRNEIVWRYKKYQKANMRYYTRNSDRVLYYIRSNQATYNPLFEKLKTPKRYLKRKWDKTTKRIVNAKNDEGHVQYVTVDQQKIDDVWELPYLMPAARERVGYPTQKPLALLTRIIQASSNKGDVVFDPFAGCATTLIAAQAEGRQWVGIDLSPKAVDLVVERIEHLYVAPSEVVPLATIPQRTDLADIKPAISQKQWLYGAQDGYCKGCREHFQARNLTVDHIIPRSKGGTDHVENLQLLCGHCNSLKGDRPMEYLMARLVATSRYGTYA